MAFAGTLPGTHRAGSGLAWTPCSASIYPSSPAPLSSSCYTFPPAPLFLPALPLPLSSTSSPPETSLSNLLPTVPPPEVSFLNSDLGPSHGIRHCGQQPSPLGDTRDCTQLAHGQGWVWHHLGRDQGGLSHRPACPCPQESVCSAGFSYLSGLLLLELVSAV